MTSTIGGSLLLLLGCLAQTICSFRAPAIPVITKEPYIQTWIRGDTATSTDVTYWDGNKQEIVLYLRVDGTVSRHLGSCSGLNPIACPKAGIDQAAHANATSTIFTSVDPDRKVALKLSFVSSNFADDIYLQSRPVDYVVVELTSVDGKDHQIEVYFDLSSEHVGEQVLQEVGWSTFNTTSGLTGVSMGIHNQQILDLSGDAVNRDWGYQYLSVIPNASTDTTFRAGGLEQRQHFVSTGQLPTEPDHRQPRAILDSMPVLGVRSAMKLSASAAARVVYLVAYDDIDSARYYGTNFKGLWTQNYSDIFSAMTAAASDVYDVIAQGEKINADVWRDAVRVSGDKYAFAIVLSYRQTLAAFKYVWNSLRNTPWCFLKEISTNGDMQTMDVIYPASPMVLYSKPRMLELLLEPVLVFAHNETSTPFTNPFSPHQIGTYPIADATTAQQEPMPMENTGNMFLMLLALLQRTHDPSFFYPTYWPMLRHWADYLNTSLPYPANQLCTDDFTGPLANNTNLAAKGIVALQAFVEICAIVGEDCSDLLPYPKHYAEIWQREALADDADSHYRISYNIPKSYSIKYNLAWQRILNLTEPFDLDFVGGIEAAYYLKRNNRYGCPMDERHNYTKPDWLSWAALLATDDVTYNALTQPIYDFILETPSRVPLTDLYDTLDAHSSFYPLPSFIARPTMGGLFARMIDPRVAK